MLRRYSEYGDYISKVLQSINLYLKSNDNSCLTHLSYALTFRDIIGDHVFKPLILVCNPKRFSLNSFTDFLTSSSSGYLLEKLKILYEIDQSVTNNPKSAKFIIDLLTDHLHLDRIHNFNLVVQLLLSCLRPTFDSIESLLTTGEQSKHKDFYFITKLQSDANCFWNECLQTKEELPDIFEASKEYLLLGIRSSLVTFASNESLNCINFPRENLFHLFLISLRETFCLDKDVIEEKKKDEQDSAPNLRLRFEECNGFIGSKYKHPHLNENLEVDVHKHDFTKLDYKCSDFFLPEYYASYGILAKLAIEHSIKLAVCKFIEPINTWLTNRATNVYLKSLQILNNFFLLQSANPEMKMYIEAVFTDITDGINQEENLINWKYYIFSDNNVQALLSQQNLHEKAKNSFTTLKNVHLVYEDMEWITRVIIDSNSKQTYDGAFRFLLQIMYARWLLEKFSHQSKKFLTKKLSNQMHQLYLIRYRLVHTTNNVYNFIMNNIHNCVSVLSENNHHASDYHTLRSNFHEFIRKIERITLQKSDTSAIIRSLIKKFCELINMVWKVWNNEADYTCLPPHSEIDKFDNSFRYYLFQEDCIEDPTITANY